MNTYNRLCLFLQVINTPPGEEKLAAGVWVLFYHQIGPNKKTPHLFKLCDDKPFFVLRTEFLEHLSPPDLVAYGSRFSV